MISYIRGPLIETDEDMIVVEAGNVGYNIRVPLSVLESLPGIGKEVRVYTYLQIREDAMSLFGFLSRQDLKMFKQLLGVSGIGPKGALALLSAMRPEDLRLAIISGDTKAISRAPGIGSKTAQRVILDLKDRISVDQRHCRERKTEAARKVPALVTQEKKQWMRWWRWDILPWRRQRLCARWRLASQ